jgi:hypothetical protein
MAARHLTRSTVTVTDCCCALDQVAVLKQVQDKLQLMYCCWVMSGWGAKDENMVAELSIGCMGDAQRMSFSAFKIC